MADDTTGLYCPTCDEQLDPDCVGSDDAGEPACGTCGSTITVDERGKEQLAHRFETQVVELLLGIPGFMRGK